MKRIVLYGLVLVACTKARTSEPSSAGAAPVAPVTTTAPTAAAPTGAPGSSATTDAPAKASTSAPNADRHGGVGAEAIRGPDVTRSKESPAEAMNKQVKDQDGGSGTPARGGRSLVAVKSKTALDTASGVLTLRFAIDLKGAVVDAHVDGFNSEVASCIQSAMSTWRFTAPDKRTRFELVIDLVIG